MGVWLGQTAEKIAYPLWTAPNLIYEWPLRLLNIKDSSDNQMCLILPRVWWDSLNLDCKITSYIWQGLLSNNKRYQMHNLLLKTSFSHLYLSDHLKPKFQMRAENYSIHFSFESLFFKSFHHGWKIFLWMEYFIKDVIF